ncbi:MAG: hypothetical protein GZ094_03365, partial [Mariniphaga sp.]|nr:hypothetical protein [Mariniphaga sp.]
MKKSLTFAIIISISFSCQHTIEPKKLKSKVEIAEAIEFVVDSLLMDSTFVKELELAPMFSDRIPDSVFRVSLPHFSFLSKQDIDYIIWQQEQLKKTQLIDYLPDKRSIIKDKFIPNGRNMYFELSP